jgi:hypothetical protein
MDIDIDQSQLLSGRTMRADTPLFRDNGFTRDDSTPTWEFVKYTRVIFLGVNQADLCRLMSTWLRVRVARSTRNNGHQWPR